MENLKELLKNQSNGFLNTLMQSQDDLIKFIKNNGGTDEDIANRYEIVNAIAEELETRE